MISMVRWLLTSIQNLESNQFPISFFQFFFEEDEVIGIITLLHRIETNRIAALRLPSFTSSKILTQDRCKIERFRHPEH